MDQYIQVLNELGFKETDRVINDNDDISYIKYENETMQVLLMPYAHVSKMILQITPIKP